jgi:hypothetical protein
MFWNDKGVFMNLVKYYVHDLSGEGATLKGYWKEVWNGMDRLLTVKYYANAVQHYYLA